jgi:two-component system sensor histidine kinase UhpB
MNDRQLVVLEAAGLHVALENYAMGLSRRGMAVDVELLGNPGRRPPLELEVALYRIAQAAIDNSARHAGATRVKVVVRADEDAVELVVMDDGRGIESARLRDAVKQGHLGVAEMTQRAAQFGATLEITTQEVGTRVRVLWRR